MGLSSDNLLIGARRLGIDLTRRQIEQFCSYYEELIEANRRFNLTTVVELEEVQVRHFLDSVSVCKAFPSKLLEGGHILDVGTGAGFPGMPLKIAFPGIKLHLLESVSKKASFLSGLIDRLGLDDVELHIGRAEELAHQPELREAFDGVLSRAVAKLNVLAELTLPFCRLGGLSVAQKQGDIHLELEEVQNALKLLGGDLKEVVAVSLEGLDESRSLVVLNKVSPTPAKYPRRPGMPAKRPLQ